MDTITLLTATMTMLTPYIVKSGEKISEEMGSDLWNWLKRKFATKKQLSEIISEKDKNTVQLQLMSEISSNVEFAKALEAKIAEIKNGYTQNEMKVKNYGNVQKQLNITNNSGNITL